MKKTLSAILSVHMLLLMPGSGLVLCWGVDGHVAIERAGEKGNCCDTAGPLPGTEQPARWTGPAPTCWCQPCRDVPLTLALGMEIARPGHGQSQLDNTRDCHALVVPKIHFTPSSEIRPRAPYPENRKIPILSHLQTACLRI